MNNSTHILTSFDEALDDLRSTVITMGTQARDNVEHAVRGLFTREKSLLNQAIADDDEEDLLEMEIDRKGLNIIMKYRPLAFDLRMVISSMKISSNLERISDHAVSIAKRSRKIIKHEEMEEVIYLEPLLDLAISCLNDSIKAYIDGDKELAHVVIEREIEVGKVYKKISKTYTKSLESEDGIVRDYLDLVFIARYLDRVSGLSSNIAEDVIFAMTNQDVRHPNAVQED